LWLEAVRIRVKHRNIRSAHTVSFVHVLFVELFKSNKIWSSFSRGFCEELNKVDNFFMKNLIHFKKEI
jgi:hypothetical protein